MTEVWGLTGGIATGKSTVSHWLSLAGLKIIDADVIARQVVAPGTPGLQQICTTFGDHFRQATAVLTVKGWGQLVFSQPEELHRLEVITTPLIQAEIRATGTVPEQNVRYRHDAPTL